VAASQPAEADLLAAVSTLVVAAGGLLWRADGSVCLVHRPRHDDWSLPKGKVKRGEHPLAAAVREVAEETGVRAVPRRSLPSTRYWVDGAPKVVHYWAMSAVTGAEAFRPNSEVDRLDWLPAAAAAERVSYPHDAQLVRDWAAEPPVTAVVLLVRHADAGNRLDRPAADHGRPLSPRGRADADALSELLALFAPDRLVSASPLRCRQTLAPLAAAQRLSIEVDTVFDETTGDPAAAAAAVQALAAAGATTVVCSQRAVLPPVLGRLVDQSRDWRTAKGDGWLLPFASERSSEASDAVGGMAGAQLLPPGLLDMQRVRQ
jgi:8-oxo-dGTP diphosphatase